MYDYRKMTSVQRHEAVECRRLRMRPWHSPPHWEFEGLLQFMISGACYEHKRIIGVSPQRMTEFESDLLSVCNQFTTNVYAWSILPNHYHLLVQTDQLKGLRSRLGKLHGRSSFQWNGEDNQRGRQVWHNCLDRGMRSQRHFWPTVNYIHHNPVHHGYADKWQEWPWSSAAAFVKRVGRDTAAKLWREYPVRDYGKTWDMD